ncbi:hypothetical protein [Occallatibacter riparius]|uniref:Uncharacterized protein n=1 Tax=Occallatibacter riparius TaxID=1002689 RepID=A0A9J7BVJ6_9BACT|nr:hypothetical protein [Occallatibacter riparius]UWZ86561.1 hypothetical protein MOP44_11590 [Occallatibacter riparius]
MSVGRRKGPQASAVPKNALRAGQHVRIDGREEVFLILRVDKIRHLADLLRQGAVRKVQAGVPLALLSAVESAASQTGDTSQAIDNAQLSEQAS